MKAIVTGGLGFIGDALVKRLLKDEYQVSLVVRKNENNSTLVPSSKSINTYELVNIHELINFFLDFKPDIVFHLAGKFISNHKSSDINNLINDNILFGNYILEATSKSNCNNFINIGTSWQHYNNEVYNPVNLYAATKEAYQNIAKFYIESTSIKMITLKLFDTYGPDDTRNKLINYVIGCIKNNEDIRISSGEQLINLVYIDDLIEGLIIAANRLINGATIKYEEFALAPNNPISIIDLVNNIVNISKSSLNVIFGAVDYRYREVFKPWNMYTLLPGWDAQITLQEGISRLLNDNTK